MPLPTLIPNEIINVLGDIDYEIIALKKLILKISDIWVAEKHLKIG